MMTRLLRRDLVLGLALLSLTVFAAPVEPEPGANVYILQMRSGFDLYLASQLTQMGALTVVTDPTLAQYVLSDSVGKGFEDAMEALYPKPKPEEPDEKADDDSKKDGAGSMVDAYANTTRRTSSFARGEGNLFLVNRENSIVVWSTFLDRRDARSDAMNKDATQVVKRLLKFMKQSIAAASAAP